jgi:hypothetical protein
LDLNLLADVKQLGLHLHFLKTPAFSKTDLLLVNDTFFTISKKLSGSEPFPPKNLKACLKK